MIDLRKISLPSQQKVLILNLAQIYKDLKQSKHLRTASLGVQVNCIL